MAGGSGSGDSSHVLKGGGQDLTRTTGQVKRGDVEAKRDTVNLHALKQEQVRAEIARLEDLKRKVEQRIAASARLSQMSSQIRLDMTRDGLRIQIVDEQNRPMFDSGSAVVQPHMRELLRETRPDAERRSQPPDARRPHRRPGLRRRRSRLQQLGAVVRSRQCLAPRVGGGWPGR